MERLTRPAGAPRGAPRVLSDASMTMSFALPASYLQARAARAAATTSVEEKKRVENAVENTNSWEERDWEHEGPKTVEKASAQAAEDDEWEEDATPDLPDDFPRLIVNLTRVQRHHFPSESGEDDSDMMEVFHRVKNTLHAHFSELAEVLFEQNGLHVAYPEDFFAMVDYPTVIDDVPLHEYLHTLSYPSKWKSVEYLKDCLRRCSRDIRWKRDVITELKLLAEQEFAQYEEQQKRLSDEIDELTRLRDSFREKLEKMTKQEGKPKGQYLMLRKLEDIENRLMLLLDDYLKEPELEEEECYSAFGNPGGEGGVTTGMNVLDMVIAMVFGRLPRDFSQQTTTEEHFQMLFDHHIYILRLWKKDFGRLPPKSRVAPPPAADGSDAASVDELSGQARDDASDGFDEEEQAEEFSSYCRVDGSDAFGSDEPALSGGLDDDWENLGAEENSRSYDSPVERETRDGNDSDGYGADFDSDESEDEEELAEAAAARQKLEAAKPEEAVAKSSAPARPRRRRIRHTKKSKKLQKAKTERRDSDVEQDAVPFQPFACTGAVGLLRLAKENEMF
ncbi:neutral zinc metallopeptidase [Phytophthora sojae]|uniref:Neutral zinc metallopeptidase n=1 Tax=Phytophthora sojae (strain P6497) TaxID=1094619 RepID=G4YHT6_PHYSP|nr:neutral zinc metallopeptidase [Phytophthora sojae]EGZ29663.1 neutral zinc metallopeptidase [Phytophthora sojae]|eukprot:XP_009516938.1 neutral zinc metallopeptidase [Phytophthora sojae]